MLRPFAVGMLFKLEPELTIKRRRAIYVWRPKDNQIHTWKPHVRFFSEQLGSATGGSRR